MMIDPRSGRHYAAKPFRVWREEMVAEMLGQDVPRDKVADRLKLHCIYTPSDKRTRDVAGMLDALCHLLEHYGVVANDGQIKNVIWEEVSCPENPGLLVKLWKHE